MKLLLLGGNGQVGFELRGSLAALGELVVATRSGVLAHGGGACEALDVTDLDAIDRLIDRVGADIVINATAYTAVDRAEDEVSLAYRVNSDAPARMAGACRRNGARFLHYSTDYVFDGRGERPYREDDTPSPLGIYGASKRSGEEQIATVGGDSCVVRTAWVYGRHGANFARTMLRLANERDEIRVVDDQYGTPTSAALIAECTTLLAARPELPPVLHLTAAGSTTWYGFAVSVLERAFEQGMIKRLPRITPIGTDAYPTRARRPRFSVLDTSRVSELLGFQLPNWSAGVSRTLGQLDRMT